MGAHHAGVVDQCCDLGPFRSKFLGETSDRSERSHVERADRYFSVSRPSRPHDSLPDRFRLFHIPAGHHDPQALAAEPFGQGSAYAAGRAGHDVESLIVHSGRISLFA